MVRGAVVTVTVSLMLAVYAIVNGNQWESGPAAGDFMPFNHEDTIQLFLVDNAGVALGGTIVDWECQVSPTPNPSQQSVTGAENLCTWSFAQDNHSIFLRNDTCANYFVRALITVAK